MMTRPCTGGWDSAWAVLVACLRNLGPAGRTPRPQQPQPQAPPRAALRGLETPPKAAIEALGKP